jgi:phage head maturation protease
MDKQIKIYTADDLQVDEGKREAIFTINTNAIDRDGEVVQPKGMRKKDYQGNPVVFANHSYMFDPKALPIGTTKWIKSGTDSNGNDALIAKAYISDKTQEARDVFALLQDGVMKASSIGFSTNKASRPTTQEINARPELKQCKNIVRDWNLHEWSIVGIPCNPEALNMAVSKGYSAKILDILSGKVENTVKAAADIVEAVHSEPSFKQNKMSIKELNKLIAKRIDATAGAIDCDVVVNTVVAKLFRNGK